MFRNKEIKQNWTGVEKVYISAKILKCFFLEERFSNRVYTHFWDVSKIYQFLTCDATCT